MTTDRFEREYGVTVDQLTWKRHPAGFDDTAIVGPFCVYHNIETDGYCVTLNNSVWQWREDLSRYLPA